MPAGGTSLFQTSRGGRGGGSGGGPRALLTSVSAYGHADDHLVKRTSVGGLISILGGLLALVLFLHESRLYWWSKPVQRMRVDNQHREWLPIRFDITLHDCPCSSVNLWLESSSGEGGHLAMKPGGHVVKHRLDRYGNPLGDEPKLVWNGRGNFFQMGEIVEAELSAMSRELENAEGCRFQGELEIQRVVGNLRISAAVHTGMTTILYQDTLMRLSMRHTIHTLEFGDRIFSGQANPLEGSTAGEDKRPGTFTYFVQIVPTLYRRWSDSFFGGGGGKGGVETNQYSVTEYFMSTEKVPMLPSIVITYGFSPIEIELWQYETSFLHHLVKLSAVVGGCFTLTNVINQFLHAQVLTKRQ